MEADGKRVLLIDDDPDIHDVIRLILEPLGCTVRCCLTGAGGMEALRSDPPDLLLLDIMLSTPTEGLDLAARIRAYERFDGLPIIMISSLGRSAAFDFSEEPGTRRMPFDAFLEKPLDPRALRDSVMRELERKG